MEASMNLHAAVGKFSMGIVSRIDFRTVDDMPSVAGKASTVTLWR